MKTETNHIYHIVALIIASVIALYIAGINITAWQYSFVGDEWPFFDFAQHIAQHRFQLNPFHLYGVYAGEHRVLGSFWQALWVALFPDNPHFGWRFSGIVLMLPMALGLYAFVQEYFTARVAYIASLTLLFSAHLINFLKIPYLQPLGLTLFIYALWWSARTGKRPTFLNFIMLGLILGLSFYVYIGPLYLCIVWPYILPAIRRSTPHLPVKIFMFGLITATIIMIGFITTPNFSMSHIYDKTLHKEFTDNWQFFENTLHFGLSFFQNFGYGGNHFVAGPLFDLVSRLFCILGIGTAIVRIRQKSFLLLLFTYGLMCAVLSITSPYSYIPVTRSIFLIPLGCIFIAIGLCHIQSKYVIACLIGVIMCINVYRSQISVFESLGHSATSLIIKTLQEEKNNYKRFMLIIQPGSRFNHTNISAIKQYYGLAHVPFEAHQALMSINCDSLHNTLVMYFEPGVTSYIAGIKCSDIAYRRIFPSH